MIARASMKIELGDVAKDSITGFEGVVTSRTEWLYGCVRFGLQPQALHDGKPIPSEVFDDGQLVLVKKGHREPSVSLRPEPIAATGGPRPDPVQHQTPERR